MEENNVPVQPVDNTSVASQKQVEPIEVPMPQPETRDVEGGRTTAEDTEAIKQRIQTMNDSEKADILRAMGADDRQIRKMFPSLEIPVTPMTTDEVPGPDAFDAEGGSDRTEPLDGENETAEWLSRVPKRN